MFPAVSLPPRRLQSAYVPCGEPTAPPAAVSEGFCHAQLHSYFYSYSWIDHYEYNNNNNNYYYYYFYYYYCTIFLPVRRLRIGH